MLMIIIFRLKSKATLEEKKIQEELKSLSI
jgi:hypothetical protein